MALEGGVRPVGPQDLVLEPEPAGSEGTEGSLCLPPTAPAPLTP